MDINYVVLKKKKVVNCEGLYEGNLYFYGFLVLTWLPRNAERDPEGFGAQQGPEKSGPRWVAGQIRG